MMYTLTYVHLFAYLVPVSLEQKVSTPKDFACLSHLLHPTPTAVSDTA